jgi:hypothetical protein
LRTGVGFEGLSKGEGVHVVAGGGVAGGGVAGGSSPTPPRLGSLAGLLVGMRPYTTHGPAAAGRGAGPWRGLRGGGGGTQAGPARARWWRRAWHALFTSPHAHPWGAAGGAPGALLLLAAAACGGGMLPGGGLPGAGLTLLLGPPWALDGPALGSRGGRARGDAPCCSAAEEEEEEEGRAEAESRQGGGGDLWDASLRLEGCSDDGGPGWELKPRGQRGVAPAAAAWAMGAPAC